MKKGAGKHPQLMYYASGVNATIPYVNLASQPIVAGRSSRVQVDSVLSALHSYYTDLARETNMQETVQAAFESWKAAEVKLTRQVDGIYISPKATALSTYLICLLQI